MSPRPVDRRAFLASLTSAGTLLGVSALTAACGGGGSSVLRTPSARPEPAAAPGATRAPTTTTTVPPTTTTTLEPRLTTALPPLIRTGPGDRPQVAITIDDFWGVATADYLAAALDVAAAHGQRLTLFPSGTALEQQVTAGRADVWQRAVAEGHEIGSHMYSHRAMTGLPDAEITSELDRTREIVDAALGRPYPIRLVRPPGGAGGMTPTGDPRIAALLAGRGQVIAMWSIDSNGTQGNGSYLTKVMGQVRNGSVILCHPQTFDRASLAALCARLGPERGLTSVTMTGLFA